MATSWVIVVAGAVVSVVSAVITNYFTVKQNAKIENKEKEIQNNIDEIDKMRESEAQAKSNFNHYENLIANGQVQFSINRKVNPTLIEAAKYSFVEGMKWRYSAVHNVPPDGPILEKEIPGWVRIFEKSVYGNEKEVSEGGNEITQIRAKLLHEYFEHNEALRINVANAKAEKRPLKLRVDAINRWGFLFTLLGILVTLLKGLFG